MKQKGTLRLIAGLQALAAVTGMLAAGIISVGAEETAMTAAKTVGDKIIFVIRKFSVYGNFSVFGQREDDFPQIAFEALNI